MGHGDAGEGGGRGDAGETGDHRAGDAGIGAGEHLLAAAAEHERVAALEPDHLAAGAGVGDDALGDRFLAELVGTGELAGVDEPDAWA